MQKAQENKYHYLVALVLGVIGLLVILIFVSMRSGAEDEAGVAQTSINNTIPTIGSLDILDQAEVPYDEATETLTLNEGPSNSGSSDTTSTITLVINYTDLNTCKEVEDDGDFGISIYHSSVTAANCNGNTSEDDRNKCYTYSTSVSPPSSPYVCSFDQCTGSSDTDGMITCEIPINHFTEPGTWYYSATVGDQSGNGSSATTTFTINTLTAIALLDTSLDFGSMALGATSTADAVTTSIRNTGNNNSLALNAYTSNDFNCSGYGSIPLTNLKISTSTGVGYESKSFTMSTSTSALGQTIPKQTGTTTVSEGTALETLYWGLLIPSNGVAGTCTTTVTIVGN